MPAVYGTEFEIQKKGIVAVKPLVFFRPSTGGDILPLGIINEDGVTVPTESDTEAVLSAFHGNTPIAHINTGGEKTFELTFVNYNKDSLAKAFPTLFTIDGVNGTLNTDPLKGNVTMKSNPSVLPQGVLIVKTAYVDISNNSITWTDKTDDNNLDIFCPLASAVNVTDVKFTGTEQIMPVITFATYPDENGVVFHQGSGIDEALMTYTPPV